MAKVKSVWYCSECGHKQIKWSGQCSACLSWNTLSEEIEYQVKKDRMPTSKTPQKPIKLKDVIIGKTPRIQTQIKELDRVLGGGVVPGSLTLLGGNPGIGKSTLLLQLSHSLAKQGLTVLYVCGEESVEQTSMRAKRLHIDSDNLLLLNETNFSFITAQIDAINPDILIVDSIQIIYKDSLPSAPGSVTQVRETTNDLMHIAKGKNIATFIIGHVTKAGEIAGPRVLEHLVDTVLYFEGDKQHNFRLIRGVKNRFGSTDEVAVFQMSTKGLLEVPNPSELFLEERKKGIIGSVISPTVEGTRPFLVEVQALVTDSRLEVPMRRCSGIEQNRLSLLLAVLTKKTRVFIGKSDVFVSIAGGVKITEPALDLAILSACASSCMNKKINPETIIFGEVGLGGEVRSVPRIDNRLKEAIQMGFSRCILPLRNVKGIDTAIKEKIQLVGVETLEQAIAEVLK